MNAEEAFKEWEVLPHSKIIIGKAMDGTLRDMDLEQIHKDGYNAAKPEWISVDSGDLPTDGKTVQVVFIYGNSKARQSTYNWDSERYKEHGVTHWTHQLPLPTPPEQ